MKKFIRLLNVKNCNSVSLQQKLLDTLKERFVVQMRLKLGNFNQSHVLKEIRRSAAFIKTYLSKK